MLTQFTI